MNFIEINSVSISNASIAKCHSIRPMNLIELQIKLRYGKANQRSRCGRNLFWFSDFSGYA